MAGKAPTKCPKCGYKLLDEDVTVCKKCNATIPDADSRWDTKHKKKGPLWPTY